MCRPCLSLLGCFLSILPMLLPAPALAQPTIPVEEFDPALTKEFAKARFEASEATLHDLAKARRDAFGVCFRERKAYYDAAANEPRTGMPVTLNFLLETWAESVEAELARSDKPADRMAVRASHWLYSWETERITTAMWRARKVSTSSAVQAQSARLAAEIELREMLADDKRSDPFMILPIFLDRDDNDKERVRERARAQFEATQAKTRELAASRRKALRDWVRERCEQYRYEMIEAGLGEVGFAIPCYLLSDLWSELTEAELALSDKPADRLATRANQWFFTGQLEWNTRAQFQVGKIDRMTLAQARCTRLTEAIKLLEILPEEKRSEPFLLLPLVLSGEKPNRHEAKEQAKSQFEVSQAKTLDLAKARRDALELSLQMYWELYRIGQFDPVTKRPVTLDFVREAEARLLEAGLALSDTPAERLAVYEIDWEAKYVREIIREAQYRAGGAGRAAWERSRFHRLGAEMQLREAEMKLKDK